MHLTSCFVLSNSLGPTIIFERYFKDKPSRQFFACTASRDRKGCSFFQWVDEKVSAGKKLVQNEIKNKLQAEKDQVEKYAKLRKETQSNSEKAHFCLDCNLLFSSTSQVHAGHRTRSLSASDILEPSKFMIPAENKKTNAVSNPNKLAPLILLYIVHSIAQGWPSG